MSTTKKAQPARCAVAAGSALLIFQVWHDGYDGCDETDSFWFSRKSADETAARLNLEQPQEGFEWEVIEHEMADLPNTKTCHGAPDIKPNP